LLLRIRWDVLVVVEGVAGKAVESGEGIYGVSAAGDFQGVFVEVTGEQTPCAYSGEAPIVMGIGGISAQGGTGEDDGQNSGGPEDAVQMGDSIGWTGGMELEDAADMALTGVREVRKVVERVFASAEFQSRRRVVPKEPLDITGFHRIVRTGGAEGGLAPEGTEGYRWRRLRTTGTAEAASTGTEELARPGRTFPEKRPREGIIPKQAE